MKESKYTVELNRPIMSMLLNLTDECQLRCKYCFVNKKPNFMSLETGKRAIDFLSDFNKNKEVKEEDNVTLIFFGGEPTLRWDEMIVPLVSYAKKRGINNFSCTTNGLLLTEERIKWFKENSGQFLFSMDGDKYTQDLQRPYKNGKGSFDDLQPIIPILLKYFPEVTFRATVTPKTIHLLADNYCYAGKMGFNSFFVTPNKREYWSEKDIQEAERQLLIIGEIMLHMINNGYLFPMWSSIEDYLLEVLKPKTADPINPKGVYTCGLGTTSIGVTTDGKISACQEQSSKLDEDNIFYIGDVFNGFDKERHQKLLNPFYMQERAVLWKNGCENCDAYNFCQMRECPSENYDITKGTHTRPEIACRWTIGLYKTAQHMIELAQIQNNTKPLANYLKFLIKRWYPNINIEGE